MGLMDTTWGWVKEQAKEINENAKIINLEKQEKKVITLEVIAGNPLVPTGKVHIAGSGKPNELQFETAKSGMKTASVKGIAWQEKDESNTGKAIAGAVVGAVALGGIGAAVGAVAGSKKKDNSVAVMAIADGMGREFELYLRCSGKEYEILQQIIGYEESVELRELKRRLGK